MSSAREAILERIRAAISPARGERESEYSTMVRRYGQHGTLDRNGRLTLFEGRLIEYGATVVRCVASDLPQTIARALAARNKHSMMIPVNLPKQWMPESIFFRKDDGLRYDELDNAEGVLTGCALAIAATGTIVLCHSAGEGRRALTLIPDYHLCIVLSNQVVETVVEGVRAMTAFGKMPLTTISGPSATSDIEMTRIQGVHGPRILDVILVFDEREALNA